VTPLRAVLALAAIGTLAQHWPQLSRSNVRHPGVFRAPPLAESSGAARSAAHPGFFWSINDSENPASLFLADTLARVRGFVRLAAPNHDWEAVAVGPCPTGTCVYIGDLGDNRAIRRTVTVYRVPEPSMREVDDHPTIVPESLRVRYPSGPDDAESLVVTGAGDLGIVTKGRAGRPRLWRVGASAWANGEGVAEFVADLRIPTSLLLGHLVTDAALSPSGDTMAVRTYRNLYLLGRAAGRPLPTEPLGVCPIGGLDPQGEGITWWSKGTWLMTSEVTRFAPGSITLLECHGSAPGGGG